MSKYTFKGEDTQSMIDDATGNSPEKELSRLEKIAKQKSKNKKVRHSLYMDREIMEKLYTESMKTGVSVNDMIIGLIEDEVKNMVIDEEKVVDYENTHSKKGNRLRTNKNVESTSKTND